jgi:hypothetical protein
MRARILVAIFTVSMVYASSCSTTCMFGVCPNQEQPSARHDCEHASSHHSGNSHHHGPEKSDCSFHDHPSVNLIKADELIGFQLTSTGKIAHSDLLHNHLDASAGSLNASWLSDLAPPHPPKAPLYQQISVLRI